MANADLDPVIAAFDRKDYKAAAKLLKPLLARSPEDPWILLYAAKLQDVAGKTESATAFYRKVLQLTTNPKLALQARQGLQHLDAQATAQRQDAIAAATAAQTGNGVLILEAIAPEQRQSAALQFAKILNLDPYTARLQLPSRGWRLYRMGSMGELQVYGDELRTAGIPVFWHSLDAVRKINVFRVQYLQETSPSPTVICQNEAGQVGALSFDWSEVSQRVKGLLPIFEQVVEMTFRRTVKRKDATQDYAQVYDLHLGDRHSILRFCDSTYQFQSGVNFESVPNQGTAAQSLSSNRLKWNTLAQFLDQATPAPTWSDFTPFAESAVNQLDLLIGFPHYIDLLRKEESSWDVAFHLYSGLVFLQGSNST